VTRRTGHAVGDVIDAQQGPSEGAPATSLPFRKLAPAWAALLLVAVLAWVVTVDQSRGMGVGPGTMGLALVPFLALWIVMMAAMMFPSVAPVAILWSNVIRGKSDGWHRVWRLSSFIAGYIVAWAVFGVAAYVALLETQRLVDARPGAASWLGVAVFAAAGLYQLTPLKQACLRHCRSPMMALFHYSGFKGPARDLRVGIHHGLYCVGCCWGLMLVLVAVGVMNVAAMVALAVIIFVEKLWRRGVGLSKAVGIAFLLLAVLVPFAPWLLPGLRSSMSGGM
jgi:predicted metal-binding membrane protein